MIHVCTIVALFFLGNFEKLQIILPVIEVIQCHGTLSDIFMFQALTPSAFAILGNLTVFLFFFYLD